MSDAPSDSPSREEQRQAIIEHLREDRNRYPDLADDIDFLLNRMERPVTDSVEDFVNTMTIKIIRQELRKRGSSTLG